MRLRVTNGSSYYQPCTQNCFVFCGFSRFAEAALLMIFLALACWRTWTIELFPDLLFIKGVLLYYVLSVNRWWLLPAFDGRSLLRDQMNACRIDDQRSCCWLLGAMSLTSSVKNKWLHVGSSAKSLINIRKRRGQNTEPRGTPLFTVHSLEWWSSNFTLKVLLFRNSSTQRFIFGWITIASIFLISRRWHTESNALEKSGFTTSTGSPWSVIPVSSSSAMIRLVRHERLGTNQCWASLKREPVFKYWRTFAFP